MADELKIGTVWGDDELDEIVADYFAMLDAELSGHGYVKSRRNAAMMERTGRSHGSVEFKHQNISAVLDELGLPWIRGYKPRRNFQTTLFEAIDRYLSARGEAVLGGTPKPEAPVDAEGIFVGAPERRPEPPRPPELERLVGKFDPVARDYRNRTLGSAGEAFVLDVERKRLAQADRPDLARQLRWVAAEDGDGAGYDVRSFDLSGRERLIEVKTTKGAARTPFFLTRNEHDLAGERPDSWRLYRVHLFAQAPRIFTIAPPLSEALHLRTESWRASFG
jgi:hypothetical protein